MKQKGDILIMGVYIKEEQLKLIKEDWRNLEKIDNQYDDVCLEAVKQSEWALKYVKEQTEEMCLEAIKQEGANIQYVKNKTPELCFYAFLNDYSLLEFKYIKKGIDEFINNQSLKNSIFSLKEFENTNKSFYKLDIESFIYLKDYLLKQNNNKYILDDSIDVEILKDIALSNNELIIVDTESIINVHKKLANRIVKEEDLKKESF